MQPLTKLIYTKTNNNHDCRFSYKESKPKKNKEDEPSNELQEKIQKYINNDYHNERNSLKLDVIPIRIYRIYNPPTNVELDMIYDDLDIYEILKLMKIALSLNNPIIKYTHTFN